jgi:putative phosphoribosyl transferase
MAREAVFANRRAAGELLAERLHTEPHAIVVGIARGGVIVAQAVARTLGAPLDIVVIRKVGHPLQPELALGAVSASGEMTVTPYADDFTHDAMQSLFDEKAEAARILEDSLRGGVSPLSLEDATTLIVDDGMATSATMACAIAHARRAGAKRIVCAAPVAPVDSISQIAALCDAVVVLVASFDRDFAVGRYYADFREVDDRQVADALAVGRQ